MTRKNTRYTAFSLIELLVVVSIIAMLIAIVVPSLSASRRSARTAICVSHLDQIAKGFFRRQVDVKAKVVQAMHASAWTGTLAPYLNESGVFLCAEGGGHDAAKLQVENMFLQVIAGGNHIYDMELAPGPLTLLVDRNTTDSAILEEVDPDITQAELDSIPQGAYRLYFEDLRPHGGDRDFRDVVLEIEEHPDGVKLTYVQDAAGYTFNLVLGDGTVFWENMDNGGTTKPGTAEVARGASASYGMNESVINIHKASRNAILVMDYRQMVVNWGLTVDVDPWTDWTNEFGGLPFARHLNETVNVLRLDGSVETSVDPSLLDPALLQNVDEFWRAVEPDTAAP